MAARGARTLFITGATGFVGGAVARRAVAAGYRVAGLARSEKAAEQLARVSVIARRGDLSDLASLAVAIDGADVIVHCAFARDAYDRLDAAVETEVAATTFLVKSCARGGVRFLYTSGIGVVGPTGPDPVGEHGLAHTPAAMKWRRDLERLVVGRGGVAIRPAFVYGHAGGEVLPALLATAAGTGASLYPAPGDHVWPNVHVDDLADAYLRAATGPAGLIYNAAGGETTPMAVAEAIGRMIGAPGRTRSIPRELAAGRIPYAAWLSGPGILVDTTRAREVLGWFPSGPTLLDDLEHGSYRRLLPDDRAIGKESR